MCSNDSSMPAGEIKRYFTVKQPGDPDYEGESWARDVTAEVAALRAELEACAKRDEYAKANFERVSAERDAMRAVVEAAVRRRIAWLKDDDDAENIAADRAEDAAVDAYREATRGE